MEAAGADLDFPREPIVPVRTLQDIDRGLDWRKLRDQALNAGRTLARAVFEGSGHPGR